jgi:phytanoyl-CoA hydroxylase
MASASSSYSAPPLGLTPEQLASYERDGFLVVKADLDAAAMASMKARAEEIASEWDGSQLAVFETSKEQKRDSWFLDSGALVRTFAEPAAIRDGKPVLTGAKAVNKIGHNLHELEPAFRDVCFSARVQAVYRSLGFVKPRAVQSMYIFKNADVGGEVNPHQDSTFLWTEPRSCVGVWWALADCTLENGCLWAVPGSHKTGVTRRFKRSSDGLTTEFEPAEAEPLSMEGGVPIECPAGTLVLIHGAVVHWSAPNTSSIPRPAFSMHVVEGKEGISWPADNWLQRPADVPFRSLFDSESGTKGSVAAAE